MCMKKYVLGMIAVLILLLDVRLGSVSYPAFEEFRTEAPNTVNMVINHVVGDKLMLDPVSDALGFALIFIVGMMFLKEAKEDNNISPSESKKRISRWKRACVWSVAGLILYVTEKVMPFYLNGNLRFRAEYLLYYLLLVAEVASVSYMLLGVCKQLETISNHASNNVSTIFAMIAIGCFTIARVLFFFDLMVMFVIYYVATFIFFGLVAFRLKKYN